MSIFAGVLLVVAFVMALLESRETDLEHELRRAVAQAEDELVATKFPVGSYVRFIDRDTEESKKVTGYVQSISVSYRLHWLEVSETRHGGGPRRRVRADEIEYVHRPNL